MFIPMPIMHTISRVWRKGGVISTHAHVVIDASDDDGATQKHDAIPKFGLHVRLKTLVVIGVV